jgi:NAD(P)H-dependent FMN reductase
LESSSGARDQDGRPKWAYGILKSRTDAEFEIIDIEDYKLPLLDEPVPPSMRQYSKAHTKTWSAKINSLDAFIFVTPTTIPYRRR